MNGGKSCSCTSCCSGRIFKFSSHRLLSFIYFPLCLSLSLPSTSCFCLSQCRYSVSHCNVGRYSDFQIHFSSGSGANISQCYPCFTHEPVALETLHKREWVSGMPLADWETRWQIFLPLPLSFTLSSPFILFSHVLSLFSSTS